MPIVIDKLFPTPELNVVEKNEVVIKKKNKFQNDKCRFTVLKTNGPTSE